MISCILTTPDIRHYFNFFLDYPSIVKIVRTLQKAINPDYHEHVQKSIDLRSRTFITDRELMKMLDWFPSVEKVLHALSHAYVEGRSKDLAILQSHQGLDFVTEEILATTLRQHRLPFYNAAALFFTPKLQRFIETKDALVCMVGSCKIEDVPLFKEMIKKITPSTQNTWVLVVLLRLLKHPDVIARRYLIEELLPIMDEFLKSQVFDISLNNGQFDTVQEVILDPCFREVRDRCLSALASFLGKTDNRPLFEFFLNQNPDRLALKSLLDHSIKRGDFSYLEEVLVKRNLDISQRTSCVIDAYFKTMLLNDNTAKPWIHALLQKEIVCSNNFWFNLEFHFYFNDYTLGFIRKLIQNPLPLERTTVVAIVKRLYNLSHSPEWEEVWDLLLKSRHAQFIPFSLVVSLSYHSIIQNVEGTLTLILI